MASEARSVVGRLKSTRSVVKATGPVAPDTNQWLLGERQACLQQLR
jgi:hypothetical protein